MTNENENGKLSMDEMLQVSGGQYAAYDEKGRMYYILDGICPSISSLI